jgi:hypothetical protein
MTLVKPIQGEVQAVMAVEGEIRELVREEIVPARKPQRPTVVGSNNNEITANDINALLSRSTHMSVKELDGLIATLQAVREQLANEGERIQRVIARYVNSSHATMESVKVIAESVSAWKNGGPARQNATEQAPAAS